MSGRRPRQRGFSLIELLVVIVIIGILAAIAIPIYLSQREKAKEAALKSTARYVLIAAADYAASGLTIEPYRAWTTARQRKFSTRGPTSSTLLR